MKRVLIPILAFVAIMLTACGSEHTVTVTKTVAAKTGTPKVTPDAPKTTPKHPKHPLSFKHAIPKAAKKAFTFCDQNIQVRTSNTTCKFAQNVFFEYWKDWHGDSAADAGVLAYSPVSHQYYQMTCAGGVTRTCKASDGAEVRFPYRAVTTYRQDQADYYAAHADIGPGCQGEAACGDAPQSPSKPSSPAPHKSCTAGYSICIPPTSDVNCGDLSETDIGVTGSDPYGLDADGDGIGCESSTGSSPAPSGPSTGGGSTGPCNDGTMSNSIGKQGACSHHGGVA